ncbi:MAG: hypothetical protein ACK559_19475, partial [bacterium]
HHLWTRPLCSGDSLKIHRLRWWRGRAGVAVGCAQERWFWLKGKFAGMEYGRSCFGDGWHGFKNGGGGLFAFFWRRARKCVGDHVGTTGSVPEIGGEFRQEGEVSLLPCGPRRRDPGHCRNEWFVIC